MLEARARISASLFALCVLSGSMRKVETWSRDPDGYEKNSCCLFTGTIVRKQPGKLLKQSQPIPETKTKCEAQGKVVKEAGEQEGKPHHPKMWEVCAMAGNLPNRPSSSLGHWGAPGSKDSPHYSHSRHHTLKHRAVQEKAQRELSLLMWGKAGTEKEAFGSATPAPAEPGLYATNDRTRTWE